MTTVTLKFLEENIKPYINEEAYRQILKMFETQYAFEKSFMIINDWRNEHLKICPVLNPKLQKILNKNIMKGVLRHLDSRTGIAMTTCGKHCIHNESSWNG